ncbi:unnamed protein product [Caenorhabditis bovis]|uniref:Fizzy-related protein homolog n=1 Tax=Caenorhabditis bovis TaxID=2654633 RepID=A0A8S1EZS3_9PELO|nr:unnamed protein product [Caenorhabditis bovis]
MDSNEQPTPRRTLGQHNPGTSPIKTFSSAHSSPRVTPTKGANPYGDRFIPLRQPHQEWNARFCAINNPDFEPCFKKPMGNSNRANNAQPTPTQTPTTATTTSSSSSSHSSDYYHHAPPPTSGATTPTGQIIPACFDESRRDEMVVRALLRNEMLKERIDDVKMQFLPSDEQLMTLTSSNLPRNTSGIFPQLERNAYGGSGESIVLPMDDTTRNSHPSNSTPSTDIHDRTRASAGGSSNSLGSSGHSSSTSSSSSSSQSASSHSSGPTSTPNPQHSSHNSQASQTQSSTSATTSATTTTTHGCGESPRPISSPLIPINNVHQSPARSLFTYSAKTTPNKYGSPSTSVNVSPFNGPLGEESQRLLRTPRKPQRKVPKNPYKVLDAPELQDDFYLNLVDWSAQNQLAVGLSSCVYLWSATTSLVTKLCDLIGEQDTVTSVQWGDKGDLLAVGTNRGVTQIWDSATLKKIRDMPGHTSRIGCLAWNGDTICSGSRDRTILHRDIRCDSRELPRTLTHHRQEVCGLKWSPDKQLLASGGNDNQLLVWNMRRPEPMQTYTQHNAAVKALAWSPHHHGLLVSGGGTADRCLRFWNTLTAQPMQCIDTGSQVCNVAWSKHSSELVSTHGYSYNHVIIWKYPSLQPVTKLVGHQYRVLYLAMSPDGESIVTGAGDETLRFWHVFSKSNAPRIARSKLNLLSSLR